MKCTSCNNIVRPVVAIDIDGTLGEYHDHLVKFAKGYLGRTFPAPSYIGEGEFGDWFEERGVSREMYRQVKLAYRQGGAKRVMPLHEGARHLVTGLRASGAEVWLCTTRPYQRLDNIDPDTKEWLRRHLIQYDGLIYGERKYEDLVNIVGKDRIVGVLDDLPEMIDHATELGLHALQIRRVHNASKVARRSPHVLALGEAELHFRERVEQWIQTNSDTAK